MPAWLRVLLGGCLIVEGASTALWLSSRLAVLAAYGGVALLLMLARGLIGALQLMAGSLLWRGARPAAALGFFVFVASAGLYALELGLNLRPSSVYPGARSVLVGVYAAYAVTAALLLRRWAVRV